MKIFGRIIEILRHILMPAMTPEMVEITLQTRAAAVKEASDWRSSVVDLLKILGMPSDMESRRQLADELGIISYAGTASQNQEMHAKLVDMVAEHDIHLPPHRPG